MAGALGFSLTTVFPASLVKLTCRQGLGGKELKYCINSVKMMDMGCADFAGN